MQTTTTTRGYALPMVLVLVAVLAAGLSVLLVSLQTSSTSSTRLFRRTQAQYAISGVARAAAIAAGDSLMLKPPLPEPLPNDATARAAAIAAHLATQRDEVNVELAALAPDITPAGFVIDDIRVAELKERRTGQVQEGSFRGMNAFIQPFDVVARGHHDSLRDGSFIRVDTSVERLFIPMFQFFAFIDGYAFIFNGPGAKYAGRIHSNGNMCLGSGQNTFLEKVTSGGSIYKLRGSGCRTEASGGIGSQTIFVSRAPLAQGVATYATAGFESGFSLLFNKDADSPDWATAAAQWNGQVQDQAHGVPVLRAPIRGTPLVQRGRDAVHALRDNTQNSRFLIDPVLPSEPVDVRSQKIAFKADLRIIDGVWYLRDPANPANLGTPIWSDHPGRARIQGEETWGGEHDVGQTDLFGAGARPRRYSYYRTVDDTTAALAVPSFAAADRPVLSYGVLHRTVVSGQPLWLPGHMRTTPVANCQVGPQNAPGMCFPTQASSTTAQLLQGTRGGLRSAWDESGVAPGAQDCGVDREPTMGLGDFDAGRLPLFNMLPINIDLAALQAALTDRNAGELGSHFVSREFNGVVFVSSTWPGYRTGFGTQSTSTAGTFWPFQGQQDDPLSGTETGTPAERQPDDGLASATRVRATRYDGLPNFDPALGVTRANRPYQRALPQPLCTDTGFALPPTRARRLRQRQ